MSLDIPQKYSWRRSASRVTGIVVLLLAGVFIGRYLLPATAPGQVPWQLVSVEEGQRQFVFPTFWEAWDTLHNHYIDDLDDIDLFYGAVAGMVRATGDPYTVFSDPDDTKQFQETLDGEFSGVGVEIGLRNGLVTVIAPLEGSPADLAGVLEEDVIVAIDEEPVAQDMSLDDVVQRIRGPRGQPVVLSVLRRGENETKDIKIVRNTITIESVHFAVEGGIAHVEIASFNGDTFEQFTQLARQVNNQNVQGVILDLRGNPGGFLQSAVDVASFFLDPGTLVVTERGREDKEYKTRGGSLLAELPTVVLVNRGSASASEILAGSLQEQRAVPIIGTQTFGKGSVQELIALKDGSSLRITVAKWFTPQGRSINDAGIEPTITVEDDRQTEEDEQLAKAREELNNIIGGN
jgi:carboxyl-terminal processing protease